MLLGTKKLWAEAETIFSFSVIITEKMCGLIFFFIIFWNMVYHCMWIAIDKAGN